MTADLHTGNMQSSPIYLSPVIKKKKQLNGIENLTKYFNVNGKCLHLKLEDIENF